MLNSATGVKTIIAAGGSTGWHMHKVPEVIYVNKGTLTLKVIESNKLHTYTLKSGEAAVEALNIIHQGLNLGSAPVELIAVFIGREDLGNITPVKLPKNIILESRTVH